MRKVASFLRDQGFQIWVDDERLMPGTPEWEESIENGIKQSIAVVVLLSPDSKESDWVRREITYADQFDKGIFPALLRGDKETSLPLRLVTHQYADLRKNEDAGLTSLASAIKRYIGANASFSTPEAETISKPSIQRKMPSRSWMLVGGIILALFVFGALATWISDRIYAPQSPADQAPHATEIVEPTDSTESLPLSSTVSEFISTYLIDAIITDTDSFDTPETGKWNIINGTVENGMLTILGNANYDCVFYSQTFSAGQGAVIDFIYSEDAAVEFFLDEGLFGDESYRRFGVYIEAGRAHVNEYGGGNKDGSGFSGSLVLKPETTYSILIAYLPDAELLQVIWDPSDPSETLSYRETMDSSWFDLALTYFVQAGSGTVQLDNFLAIQFSGAR